MDVSLVLTHRCNLACSYCFAGDHHERTIDRPTIDRAVGLLFADDPAVAQLSFFGGEPLLAFEAMRYAMDRARELAGGRRLLFQVTTNGTLVGEAEAAVLADAGVGVTVSVDGVREAHELQRPRAGGQSSFDAVTHGLRALVDAGAEPDALLVITPDTVAYLEASVAWLWSEGVMKVGANLDLRAAWTSDDREDLRAALIRVGADLVRMRRLGHEVGFEPFGLGARGGACFGARPRVVVAASGNLYPCSPMVGEDRDGGREARQRMGHVSDEPAAIVGKVFAEGVHCSTKGDCACSAYVETGETDKLGPNGEFWKTVGLEIGAIVAAELAGEAQAPMPMAAAGAMEAAVPLAARGPERRRRKSVMGGLMMGAGALGFVSASLPGLLRMVQQKRACSAGAASACNGHAVDVAAATAEGEESYDAATEAGVSDATGLPQRSVLDKAAFQAALAQKGAQPIPIPKAGPPRKPHRVGPSRVEMHIAGGIGAHDFNDDNLR